LTSDARCDDGQRTNDKRKNNENGLLKEDSMDQSIYIDVNYQKKYIFSSPASVLQGTVREILGGSKTASIDSYSFKDIPTDFLKKLCNTLLLIYIKNLQRTNTKNGHFLLKFGLRSESLLEGGASSPRPSCFNP
jgi:hypothetical protein